MNKENEKSKEITKRIKEKQELLKCIIEDAYTSLYKMTHHQIQKCYQFFLEIIKQTAKTLSKDVGRIEENEEMLLDGLLNGNFSFVVQRPNQREIVEKGRQAQLKWKIQINH